VLTERVAEVMISPTCEIDNARLMLERIKGSVHPPRTVVFTPQLVIRQSCAHHIAERPGMLVPVSMT
jgi:hypothetical protein